jgi:hypothetical protein
MARHCLSVMVILFMIKKMSLSGSTGIWFGTQELRLARQAFYHLSHLFNPFSL